MDIFNPKPKPKLVPGSEVLQGLFENGKNPISQQFIRWKLWRSWSDYVGESISAVTEPVSYQRGCLYIFVKHSTWLHHLNFMKDTLKTAINDKLEIQYVYEIKLVTDRKYVPRDAEAIEELQNNIDKLIEK